MSQEIEKVFQSQARRFHIVANEKSLPYLNNILNFLTTKPYVYILCRKGYNKRNCEHAHIYVVFKKPVRLSNKNTHGCHIAKCRGTTQQNIDYIKSHHPMEVCEKGEVPENDGDIPPKKWDGFVQQIKQRKVDKFDPMFARYEGYANRRLAELMVEELEDYEGDLKDKNCWIYGKPGTGKSYSARYCKRSKIYPKPVSKWWDGYKGQKVVVMDDLDPDRAKMLADKIKIWTDKYPFVAEVKSASAVVDPRINFIVTSNYSIEDCFEPKDVEALKRRFTILHFTGKTIEEE